MTIQEVAKVAKPGEYWTGVEAPRPVEVMRIAEGCYLDQWGNLYRFTPNELLSVNWHRCDKDGNTLEEV